MVWGRGEGGSGMKGGRIGSWGFKHPVSCTGLAQQIERNSKG